MVSLDHSLGHCFRQDGEHNTPLLNLCPPTTFFPWQIHLMVLVTSGVDYTLQCAHVGAPRKCELSVSTLDLLTLYLHFNRISRYFVRTMNSEENDLEGLFLIWSSGFEVLQQEVAAKQELSRPVACHSAHPPLSTLQHLGVLCAPQLSYIL